MSIFKSTSDGYAGFNISDRTVIIGAVKKDQEFECVEGIEIIFEKTLSELETSLNQ